MSDHVKNDMSIFSIAWADFWRSAFILLNAFVVSLIFFNGVSIAADGTQLKMNIHNKTINNFEFVSKSTVKSAPSNIKPHADATITSRTAADLSSLSGNVVYKDSGCEFKLKFFFKKNSKHNCAAKDFTITYTESSPTCLLEKTECKGTNGCNCHFDLTNR